MKKGQRVRWTEARVDHLLGTVGVDVSAQVGTVTGVQPVGDGFTLVWVLWTPNGTPIKALSQELELEEDE